MSKRSDKVDLFRSCRDNGCSRPYVGDSDVYVVVEKAIAACSRTLEDFSNEEFSSHRSVDELRVVEGRSRGALFVVCRIIVTCVISVSEV